MSGWIIAIVCIVALGVLLDVIMPEGEINKYVKSVFSIVTVVAIVAPLPALLGGDFDIGGYFDNLESYSIDGNYIREINEQRKTQAEERLDELLKQADMSGAKGTITFEEADGALKIKAISVDIKNIVINGEAEHKDIIDKLKKLVSAAFGVKKESVNVYG